MIEAILPVNVSVSATRADIPDAAVLPEEEAMVRRAVASRRREFATARACARAALEPWDLSQRAIPTTPSGAPQWPVGIVGSITHCVGYRACAVASVRDVVAIGIDAEPDEPLPGSLLRDVAVRREREWVTDLLRSVPEVRWDRLLFCIKEAVYKAWHPLAERRLDFDQAVISLDLSSGSFTARLLVSGPPVDDVPLAALSGRWMARDGIVLAAIALPRRSAS
jgi:4'-phosphopantetheinyl transferase EntD